MTDAAPAELTVSAIVIAYKSADRIVEAIEQLEAAMAHLDAELIIVDNASGDGTVELARRTLRRGHVIANDDNFGYGHAANLGIAAARGRTCLILNDDAVVTAEALDRMLQVLDSDPSIALVGPRIVDSDGLGMPSARLDFPGLREEIRIVKNKLQGVNENNIYPDISQPTDVAWLVGACILGRTDVLIATGGFNPVFFLYAEDIDLCKRIGVLGHRIVTVPDAVCTHVGSVSTTQAFTDRARVLRRAEARNLFYRLWYRKGMRSLIHLRRAIGFRNQPLRLKYHLPRVFSDGGSLEHERFPKALSVDR